MKNRNGFTLIELISIIVIICLLFFVITPFINNKTEESNKKKFADISKKLIQETRNDMKNGGVTLINGGICSYPEAGKATSIRIITDEANRHPYFLEVKHDKSSFNKKWKSGYIIIYNKGNASTANYNYYISLIDEGGNGIGFTSSEGQQNGTMEESHIDWKKIKVHEENIYATDIVYVNNRQIGVQYRCEIKQ